MFAVFFLTPKTEISNFLLDENGKLCNFLTSLTSLD